MSDKAVFLITGIALIVIVAAASVGVVNTLAGLDMPIGQAIACSPSSPSGGGC